MPTLTSVDEDFLRVPRRFLADLNAEFDFDAVLFGGSVRDALLGYEPNDIDIIVTGNPFYDHQYRESVTKWLRTNSLFVSNSVCCKNPYDKLPADANSGKVEFCGGPILSARFKGSMKDIHVQIMSEANFIVRGYLEDDLEISSVGVLIPQLSCNRIACDERANLFSEEDYMERLESAEFGVSHNISLNPKKVAERIIKFYVTRHLTPDYSAIEFINTVIPWGKMGTDFICDKVTDSLSSSLNKTNGETTKVDPHMKKVDLFSLLGRKMNG